MEQATTPTLVEIDQEYRAIVAQIEASFGELTPESEAAFDTLALQLCEKVDGYGIVIQRLEHEAEFWKMQKDRCAKIQSAWENAAERLKERMKFVLKTHPDKSLEGALFRFYLTKAKPKLVLNDLLLPQEYKVTQVNLVPDKDKIRGALEAGVCVPGAQFEGENYSLKTGRPKK